MEDPTPALRRAVPQVTWRHQLSLPSTVGPPILTAMLAKPSRQLDRALIEAGLALASELSLEAVLQRIVELAVEITDARYGALGVLRRDRPRIEEFITVGVTDEDACGDRRPPVGHGILGVLIDERRPAPAPRHRRGPPIGRLPAEPPADALVPGRAGDGARARSSATSTSPRSRAPRSSARTTRPRSSCSRPRPASRSRTRACTTRRSGPSASSLGSSCWRNASGSRRSCTTA